jgi:ATP-dependent RNA helicase DHX8/PRP22
MDALRAEILKHAGVEDEEVADFVIHLHEESSSLQQFRESLYEMGAEFPEEFVMRLFYALKKEKKTTTVKEEPQIKQEVPKGLDFLSLPNVDIKQEPLDSLWDDFKHEDDIKHQIKREMSPERHFSNPRDEYRERDDVPVVGKIYRGRVMNMTNFGAFVRLDGVHGRVDGLVHVSAIAPTRVEHPTDALKRTQEVFVRVNDIKGSKISLSMKDVDQYTGELIHDTTDSHRGRKLHTFAENKKRLTSPERWELRQLIASGAISAKDHPELEESEDRESDLSNNNDEELDVEVKQSVPPFLAGLNIEPHKVEPNKVIKLPEGSLNRAAMTGSALAKERRERKIAEMKEEREQKLKENINKIRGDPLVEEETPQEDDVVEFQRRKNKNISFGKRTNMTMKEQRESLPVFQMRDKLLKAIHDNQFIVIVGETGSGKTTQLTQYLHEDGFSRNGMIGCTQPRRVAATSVAKRVSEEMGVRLGEEVGYNVRFDDNSSPQTKIKYLTDGMLQREALMDPDLSKYSVIMLDEAHERTIATDILFSLLKKTASRRPDLKVIVTSATLDSSKFSKFFNSCPIVEIPGRTFPVEIMYTREPETDYLAAALDSVIHIHVSEGAGDILVFLTGADEIETSVDVLNEKMRSLGADIDQLIVLPVYSALPTEIQSRIFEPTPPGSRKVILATNIAETSLTIDGIFYVVDPGFSKVNMYDPRLGIDTLTVKPISQAQANQRAGRAGRTGPGKCYRLYTELAFKNEMLPNTIPEIQRQNLSNTILMLKAIGINDLIHFEFMDPPSTESIMLSLNDLYYLRAVDDESRITSIGRNLVNIPAEPKISKTLIESIHYKCSDEMITIFSMITTPNIFFRPKNKEELADKKKARFHHPHGDHLTLLNVYNHWVNSGYSREWCQENFVQERSLKRARDIRRQLVDIFKRNRYPVLSCDGNTNSVRRALCSGFFRNVAKRDNQEGYKTLEEGTQVYIHPGSSVRSQPQYVLFDAIRNTTKEYLNHVTVVEPQWLVEVAPEFFEANGSKTKARRKEERIVPLFNRYKKDQDDWRLSRPLGEGEGKKRFRA